VQHANYQNILFVTLVKYNVGSMVEAPVSIADFIGLSTDTRVFSQGLETGDH
jgi:hypothetical protein